MIEKKQEEDQHEIVGQFNHIQVRTATWFEEDGVAGARTYHRHVVTPGDDTSNASDTVKALIKLFHTTEIIKAHKEFVAKQET